MTVAIFPTPWTVQHAVYSSGGDDPHGNEEESWAQPVDRKVYGWGAPQSSEPKRAGAEAVVVNLELYAPVFPVGDMDRIVVDGLAYDVIGEAEDFNHGPFGFAPGMVVNLKRAE